jgi:hypothetical protein
MPQREFRITAPLNQTPKWPDGYIAVLREAGAQEKTIPYCIGWVRQFFATNPNQQRRDLGRTEIEAFLAQLTRRAEIGNWQVQQARDALELYYERFRGIALAPRPDVPAHLNDPPSAIAAGSVPALSHNATPPDGEVQRDYSRSETPVNAFSTPGDPSTNRTGAPACEWPANSQKSPTCQATPLAGRLSRIRHGKPFDGKLLRRLCATS